MLSDKIKTTDTKYGPMVYYADDLFIGKSLENYGEYSEAEPDLWRKFIKPGSTVLDIGANIGALTLPLAQIVSDTGKVIAIEPQPENYHLLERNCDGKTNVTLMHKAVGRNPGIVRLPPLSSLPDTNYGGYELQDDPNGDEVTVVTLDELALDHVDFIKIDVEGMEQDVLAGATDTLKRLRPVLYVEDDREERSDDLTRQIRSMGYTIYKHNARLYSPFNLKNAKPVTVFSQKMSPEPVTEDKISSFNLLCVPDERVYEFEHNEVTKGLNKVSKHTAALSNREWACVVRLGGIGDDLIAASTCRPLKKMGYMVEVITQLPQAVVFENNPYIDKLTLKDSKRDIPQTNQMEWQKYWWARSCEYAKFANLSHSMEVLLAQFPESTAFWWSPEMRRKLCGGSYLETAHDVVGVPYDFGPMFFPTEAEKADIESFLNRHKLKEKPVIAWCTSGTRLDKLYPWSGATVARLISEFDANVLLLGAPHPHQDGERAKQLVKYVELTNSSVKGVYDIRTITESKPEWPIRRILTLAQMCDLVIGPDTGPMWSVAMEPVPKILLHSHASIDNITKHWKNTISMRPHPAVKCWPCHLLHNEPGTCQETQIRSGLKPDPEAPGAACISSIAVSDILAAVSKTLKRRSAS